APERPWLELLSRRYRVIAPWHPGYGHSPLIDGGGSVDDLAYLYLDLSVQLGLENAVLVGACFGGWVAAEMMVRSTARFSHLVRGREAFALYGWKPYMHNPRLKRWLHRIDRPTLLLWGAEDRIVTPAYGEGWRRAIPGARLELIPHAGHFPHWEQPEAFAERLLAFVDKNS